MPGDDSYGWRGVSNHEASSCWFHAQWSAPPVGDSG